MLLTVKERLLLQMLLPAKGNVVSLRVIKEAQDALSPSAREKLEVELIVNKDTGAVSWNGEKDIPVEVPLSIHALDLLKDELRKREDKQELGLDYLKLYEAIVEKKV